MFYSKQRRMLVGGLLIFVGAILIASTLVGIQKINRGGLTALVYSPSDPIGSVDIINSTHIAGWTCDPDSYTNPIQVHVYDGDIYSNPKAVFLTGVTANQTRADLGTTSGPCRSTTNHGFDIPLQGNPDVMSKIADGQAHALYIYAINVGAGGNTILKGSSTRVVLQSTTPTPTPTPTPSSGNNPVGNVDILNSTHIAGWACDADSYSDSIQVHVYDGNPYAGPATFLTGVTANQTRADLGNTSGPCRSTTNHGFDIPIQSDASIKQKLNDGKAHSLYAIAINIGGGGNTVLPNGGKPLTFTGVIDANFPNLSLRAVPLKNAAVYLAWNSYPSAVGYALYVDGYLFNTITNSTTYTLPGVLMPDASYSFSVMPLMSTSPTPPQTISNPSQISTAVSATVSPAEPAKKVGGINVLDVIVSMAANKDGTGAIPAGDSVSYVKGKLFSDFDSVSKIYTQASYNNFTLNPIPTVSGVDGSAVVAVTIPYMANFPTVKITNPISTDYKTALLAIGSSLTKLGYDLTKFNVIIYTWPKTNSTANGAAFDGVGDPNAEVVKGRIWINWYQTSQTYAHEIGHLLGFYHGTALTGNINCFIPNSSSCTLEAYGDDYNLMGDTQNGKQMNIYDKYLAGWNTSQAITSSGPYTITGRELSTAKAFHFPVQDTGDEMYLDYVTNTGDFGTATNGVRLFMVRGTGDATAPAKLNISMGTNGVLSNGQMFDTYLPPPQGKFQHNFRVIQISHTNTTANVFVRFDVAPTLSATTDQTSVTLSWNAIPLASGYAVYKDGSATPIFTTSASYTDTGLVSGSVHSYVVKGYDAFTQLLNQKFFMMPSDPLKVKVGVGTSVGYMHHHINNVDTGCTPSTPQEFYLGTTYFIPGPNSGDCSLTNIELIKSGWKVQVLPSGPSFSTPGTFDLTQYNYNDKGSGVYVTKI